MIPRALRLVVDVGAAEPRSRKSDAGSLSGELVERAEHPLTHRVVALVPGVLEGDQFRVRPGVGEFPRGVATHSGRGGEDSADGVCAQAVSESGEFAVDASVSPGGVLLR